MSRTRRIQVRQVIEKWTPKRSYGTRQPIIDRIEVKAKQLGAGVDKIARSYVDQIMAAALSTDLDKIGKKIKIDMEVASLKKEFTELVTNQKESLKLGAEIQTIKNDPIGYYTRQYDEIVKRIQIAQNKLEEIIDKRAETIQTLTGVAKDVVLELESPTKALVTDEKDSGSEASLTAKDADSLDKWVGTMKQFIAEEQERKERAKKRLGVLQKLITQWGQVRGVEKFLLQGGIE